MIRRLAFVITLASFPALTACGGAASGEEGSAAAPDAKHPLIGSVGPDFSQKAVGGGGQVAFRDLKGKVAIVDFWATWCEPCKKSFPKLQELSTKYGANGFVIVGISEDDESDGIPAFASALGAKFPLAWDKDKAIAGRWKPKSMPSTYIVDRQGTVRFVHLGYRDGEEVAIEKEIKSLL
jgi:thiol-disulfide isomerase/thioredoxin